MNTQNIPLLRETTPHGNALFPFMLYDISSNPSFEERIGCHWHEEIEFLVITKGEGSLQLNGRIYPVKENDICLIPSNQLHFLTCPEQKPLDFFAIVFHPDFLRSVSRDTIQKKYLEPLFSGSADCALLHADAALLQCLSQIRQAFHAKEHAYELFIKVRLLEAFHLLATHTVPNISPNENSSAHQIVLAKSMMEYLRANYDSEITLSQLEKTFHLSRGHICRLFKTMTHMTPFSYLNYYRIQQSVEFLEHSDDEISLIATKCGFNNISYYNRTFRKYMHMTPSAFRNMQAGQSNNISSTAVSLSSIPPDVY
ncbi:MAG: AraC family transcriptional regulator [Lachnospiraceae bacterium]|nr:AraC family transcriptional regulator [Lachnospiraceae bacterium]